MKRYLFSPIGTTDPIRDFHDGALLHIIRHFKPDHVYVYMTKEMVENENNDKEKYGTDRYTYCFNMIKDVINKDFSISIERDINMEDPSDMDAFYSIFLKKINEIENLANKDLENDYEILLNISSGTPAQKSTLQVIATNGSKIIKAIQVITPHKKANPRVDNEKEATFEEIWETNEDNQRGAENRTKISEAKNFVQKATFREIIKELIRNYDYSSVYDILCSINSNEHLKNIVKSASYRLEMNLSKVFDGILDDEKDYFKVKTGSDILKNVEYILGLGVKINKNSYTDFIRGITPIIVDLFERFCKKVNRDLVSKICIPEEKIVLGKKRYIPYIRIERIKEVDNDLLDFLNEKYAGSGGFKDGEVGSNTYLLLMEYFKNNNLSNINQEQYDNAKKLRDVEQKVRNIVAHEIEYMSDERIREETGLSAKKIYNLILTFANYSGLALNDDVLSSYDRMNDYIIKIIDTELL